MSDSGVFRDMSITLKVLLKNKLRVNGREVSVSIDSPHKEGLEEPRVNLYLYHIGIDEHRRNAGGWVPIPRAGAQELRAREPLPLVLRYMLTAFAGDGLSEHLLLGQAMQVLQEHQQLAAADLPSSMTDRGIHAPITQLVLQDLDLDVINSIWGNNATLQRASVCYEVNSVFLDAMGGDSAVQRVKSAVFEVAPVPYIAYVHPEEAPAGATVRVYGANLYTELHRKDEEGKDETFNGVRISFGGRAAETLDPGTRKGSVDVVVPEGTPPGRLRVQARFDSYQSGSIEFEVVENAGEAE